MSQDEGKNAEEQRKACHQDRTKPKLGGLAAALNRRCLAPRVPWRIDDKDGVLAGQPHEHKRRIWERMSLSMRHSQTPASAASTGIGMTRMTLEGHDELSDNAARMRNTNKTQRKNEYAVLPARIFGRGALSTRSQTHRAERGRLLPPWRKRLAVK